MSVCHVKQGKETVWFAGKVVQGNRWAKVGNNHVKLVGVLNATWCNDWKGAPSSSMLNCLSVLDNMTTNYMHTFPWSRSSPKMTPSQMTHTQTKSLRSCFFRTHSKLPGPPHMWSTLCPTRPHKIESSSPFLFTLTLPNINRHHYFSFVIHLHYSHY